MSGIIKKDSVRMAEAPRQLGDAATPPAAMGPAARILEQNETGVQIEITCACGQKTYLQCEYAAGPSPD